ncbi:MAG: transposase [Saprospiraceae bacterium]
MDRNNRWIKLADALPWDEMAGIYRQSLSADNGRPTIDVRLAVGALIIKHKLGLSDREVVSTIRENVYIQYFVGYRSFDPDVPFDPSLFVAMRKRMGAKRFDEMNKQIIRLTKGREKRIKKDSSGEDEDQTEPESGPADQSASLDQEPVADPHPSKDYPQRAT